MELSGDINDIRKAFEHKLVLKKLQPHGFASIFFGAIGIYIGINAMRENNLNAILVAFGLVLILEGIWLMKKPSPKGYVVDGCLLIFLGLWNLLLTIGIGESHFVLIGTLQIVWGIISIRDSKHAAKAISTTTTKADFNKADELIHTIMNSSFDNENYIEFMQNDLMATQWWSGLLADGYSAMIGTRYHSGIFAGKDDIVITQRGKHTSGKNLKGSMSVNGKKMTVVIPAKSLERLQIWKPEILETPNSLQ